MSNKAPAVSQENLCLRATAIAASSFESLNAILKDCQLPNVGNSGNFESKIADLEAILIYKNTKIEELNIQKQELVLSIAEMGKNYAALQKDNQTWKQKCKSLVDARIKFENDEVNVLKVVYADKLKESSELNLELTTCQNQLETIEQILQKTTESKNILSDAKRTLEEKLRESNLNFEKALQAAQHLNDRCKTLQHTERISVRKFLELKISSLKEQYEALLSISNSKDRDIQFLRDSCSNLNKEKEKLLQQLNLCNVKIKKEVISDKNDISVQTDEPWPSENDGGNDANSNGNEETNTYGSEEAIAQQNSPLPRRYSYECLTKHQRYEFMVTYICDWDCFYIHLVKTQYILSSFMRRIDDYYSESRNLRLLQAFTPGTPCVMQYRGGWYRGQIVRCEGDAVVTHYVDYGGEQSVRATDVYEICDEFIREPVFAVHSRLKATSANGTLTSEKSRIPLSLADKYVGVLVNIDDITDGICEWQLLDERRNKPLAPSLLYPYSKSYTSPANKFSSHITFLSSSQFFAIRADGRTMTKLVAQSASGNLNLIHVAIGVSKNEDSNPNTKIDFPEINETLREYYEQITIIAGDF